MPVMDADVVVIRTDDLFDNMVFDVVIEPLVCKGTELGWSTQKMAVADNITGTAGEMSLGRRAHSPSST